MVVQEELAIFGRGVRRCRKNKGLSQEKLAEAAELHRNYIGLLERGERNPSTQVVIQIARALGVKPGELFSEF